MSGDTKHRAQFMTPKILERIAWPPRVVFSSVVHKSGVLQSYFLIKSNFTKAVLLDFHLACTGEPWGEY